MGVIEDYINQTVDAKLAPLIARIAVLETATAPMSEEEKAKVFAFLDWLKTYFQ